MLTPLQRGLLALGLLLALILIGQFLIQHLQDAEKQKPQDRLAVGLIDDTPPYCFYSDENKLVGVNIDFVNALAERIHMKPHIDSVSFNRLTAGLITHQYDVVSLGSITPQRAKVVRYVHPHLFSNDVLIVQQSLKSVPSIESFKGKPWHIGVYNGTSYIKLLRDMGLADNMAVYPNQRDVFLAFYKRRVDAIIMNEYVARYIQSHLDPTMVIVDKKVRTHREYALAVRRENLALWKKLDKAVTDMVTDGTFERIQQKWLSAKKAS